MKRRDAVAGMLTGLLGRTEVGASTASAASPVVPTDVSARALAFLRDVTPRLQPPLEAVVAYAQRLAQALAAAQATPTAPTTPAGPRYVLLIDRSPQVQAAMLYWGASSMGWVHVGSTPVSTGLPGRYEHFTTPLGVFDHNTGNPDFRALGTKNALGFRGYGAKGLRVYDFGWVASPRGWGDGAMGTLRLQMHSTDARLAAWRLGSAQSEGCVRIPASLNLFIDHHGLLDADYDRAVAAGSRLWVLRKDRQPTPQAGRAMVVVDSQASVRPAWSPAPVQPPA